MTTMKGKCLCGVVSVTATPEKEQIDACHCTMCRKWSGGPFIAMGCGDKVEFDGKENIGAYKSSAWAERLFCKTCGTSIAWSLSEGGNYHVAAHLFEEADKFPFKMQVFIDEKPGNYSFAEQTETLTGPELFALFGASESE